MLPNRAWALKPGEKIRGSYQNKYVEGTVSRVIHAGMTKEDLMRCGHSEMEATQRQFDGPIVIMRSGDAEGWWRPDDLELITGAYHYPCNHCQVMVTLNLPLRVITSLEKGDPLLGNEQLIVRSMLTQGTCYVHVNLDER